jgi:M6 family metalloprotease-like protein
MKKVLLICVIAVFAINASIAVPAYPGLIKYNLPDGQLLEIYLKGDERLHWAETPDGYTLILNKEGFYEYAMLDNKGDLVASGQRAYNIKDRKPYEVELLLNVEKSLFYSEDQISILKQVWEIYDMENKNAKAFPTTGNRKLICILIGFQDRAFIKTQADFNALFNQVGYNIGGATGSVKDYYLENSYNQFNLTVDVAGPYTASQNMYYYGGESGTANPRPLVIEAINFADPTVNFAQYDNDGDGWVDGVYIIYAGYGKEAGGPVGSIWAHAWSLSSPVLKDGVYIQRYSCSAELRGNSGTNLTHIGVICHEFGHVLGAPDYYDTNGTTGGSFSGTGQWDMMASGSWNNSGATPAHHNGFTKVVFYNWATATVLNSPTSVTLYNAVEYSNSFYRINTSTTNEYFFLENREKHMFDSYIPGSGMIIYHVHSGVLTSAGNNTVNTTHPQRMYPVSRNATIDPTSTPSSYGTINAASCAWTGDVKNSFTDATLPSSKSWAGANTSKPITNISRNATPKTVTFDFMGGASCTSPSNQATGFGVSAIDDNQMTVSWTRGNGNQVLVLAKQGSAVNASPSNSNDYNYNTVFGTGDNIGSGNFVVYKGIANNAVITGLTPGTTYHYAVFEFFTATNCYKTPGLAGNASTTGVAPCTPCAVSSDNDDNTGITNVTFNTINNTSTGAPAYTDFRTISTNVNKNQNHNISVSVNTDGDYTVHTTVWFDWNQDCVFDASESYNLGTATNTANGLTSLSPLSITIPPTALDGNTIMRVRTTWNTAPTACGNNNYSETEDYTINVVSAASPSISLSVSEINFGNVGVGYFSQSSYEISGTNLTNNVSIISPADFQISLTAGSGWTNSLSLPHSAGTLNPTTIFVKFEPAAPQTYSENIAHTSTGATQVNVALSGTGVYWFPSPENFAGTILNGNAVLTWSPPSTFKTDEWSKYNDVNASTSIMNSEMSDTRELSNILSSSKSTLTAYKVYKNGINIGGTIPSSQTNYTDVDMCGDNEYYVTAVYIAYDGESSPTDAVNLENLSPAAAGNISGHSSVIYGATNIVYDVSSINYATSYVWEYTGANASISGTDSSITISFALNATAGNLSVYGTNSCGNGNVSTEFPITITIVGDVNNDGKINVLDMVWMIDHLNGVTPAEFNYLAADINVNGTVDITDFTALLDIILNPSK